jgi:hypothetical protein
MKQLDLKHEPVTQLDLKHEPVTLASVNVTLTKTWEPDETT